MLHMEEFMKIVKTHACLESIQSSYSESVCKGSSTNNFCVTDFVCKALGTPPPVLNIKYQVGRNTKQN